MLDLVFASMLLVAGCFLFLVTTVILVVIVREAEGNGWDLEDVVLCCFTGLLLCSTSLGGAMLLLLAYRIESSVFNVFYVPFWALQVFAAWVLIDLFTGLYHYATDRGWNLAQQVKLFQDHHATNELATWDWQPSVVALPALVCTLAVAITQSPPWLVTWLPFLFALCLLGMAAQVPHYYAHNRTNNRWILWAQEVGLFITPGEHEAHHRGEFDRNFCIFSGFNNRWLNWFLGVP